MTSSLTITAFQARHLTLLGELSDSMVGMSLLHKETLYGQKLEQAGPCFSVFAPDGQLLGCGGVGMYWSGVGEAWLLLSARVSNYPVSLHRICSRALSRIIDDEKLHRVQAVVPQGHERARRWIERLGFCYEGLMPGYGPDQSWFERYGRVKLWRS